MDEETRKKIEEIEKRLSILEGLPKKRSEFIQKEFSDETFEENEGKIIVTQTIGDKPKEKIKNIVLLSLLGYKQKLGETDVHASKLRENAATHGMPLENFGTYVKELIPQSIIKKGKKGSNLVTYKLTLFGESKAKNLLKEIDKNEKAE